ncbi:MAG: hypothetical protein UCN61_04460, partial [Ruminococcus sp.]|nr:hypothetical protein [Ruminococcus sp.]
MCGCQSQQNEAENQTGSQSEAATELTASKSTDPSAENTDPSAFDPYAIESRYDIGDEMFEKRDGVDYGTVEKDVSYYSTTAEDDKQCNILLPAGYDESEK